MIYRARVKLRGPDVGLAKDCRDSIYSGITWALMDQLIWFETAFGVRHDFAKTVRR